MAIKFGLDFILKEFVQIHGDAYNYSEMEYVNVKTPLKIYCNTHKGYIYQRYDSHKKSKGCSECIRVEKIKKLFDKFDVIHNKRYKYNLFAYVSYTEKMAVNCSLHGEFLVTPKKHAVGQGCPKCSSIRNLNSAELKHVFLNVHGDRYTYQDDMQIDEKGYVYIKCNIHGEFKQKAYNHALGQGCDSCAKEKLWKKNTLDAKTFFNSCSEIYENKYSYSSAHYENYNSILDITCPEHGQFTSKASNHIRGSGCPKCSAIKKRKIRLKKPEIWIKEFKAVHGEKYIYDKAIFKSRSEPIEIICPLHRAFWLSPSSHKKGYGCLLCKGQRITRMQFIDRARAIHGLKYDYSNMEINKLDSYIRLKCRTHGEFDIHANSHLCGSGCKLCAIEKSRKSLEKLITEFNEIQGYYYNYDFVIYENSTSLVKIKCPNHGFFNQRVRTHRLGGQCPKCRNRLNYKGIFQEP